MVGLSPIDFPWHGTPAPLQRSPAKPPAPAGPVRQLKLAFHIGLVRRPSSVHSRPWFSKSATKWSKMIEGQTGLIIVAQCATVAPALQKPCTCSSDDRSSGTLSGTPQSPS